jgi:hypothetical protein
MAISNTTEHLTIDLTPEIKTALERKAKGQDMKIYIQGIIKKQAFRPSLDESLAPVRAEFEAGGMSEEDLDRFMNPVRNAAFEDKQAK